MKKSTKIALVIWSFFIIFATITVLAILYFNDDTNENNIYIYIPNDKDYILLEHNKIKYELDKDVNYVELEYKRKGEINENDTVLVTYNAPKKYNSESAFRIYSRNRTTLINNSSIGVEDTNSLNSILLKKYLENKNLNISLIEYTQNELIYKDNIKTEYVSFDIIFHILKENEDYKEVLDFGSKFDLNDYYSEALVINNEEFMLNDYQIVDILKETQILDKEVTTETLGGLTEEQLAKYNNYFQNVKIVK